MNSSSLNWRDWKPLAGLRMLLNFRKSEGLIVSRHLELLDQGPLYGDDPPDEPRGF